MTHPTQPTSTHPLADFRAFLDTLPPPTPEQIAAMRAKVMARRSSARGVA